MPAASTARKAPRKPRKKSGRSKSSSSSFHITDSRRYLIALSLFAMLNIVLWQFPEGRLILYPFTILSTWFHEMAHGLAAMILGGSFHELEIFSNGSGLARHSGELFLGRVGKAIVALAGPIGPAIAGAALISCVKTPGRARTALLILGTLMAISILYFMRGWLGILIITIIAIGVLYTAFAAGEKPRRYLTLFLGVQAALSTYISIDYLLSPGAHIGGEVYPSDTMVAANNLILPYAFWGVLCIFISVWLIYSSIQSLYRKR